MPDIKLVNTTTPFVTFDWLQTPTGLLDETDTLASAIIIALNSDAVADDGDDLPDPRDTNRRGWWGDLDAQSIWNGWPLGSKLWLMRRAKIVDTAAREGSTVSRINAYIFAALNPFIAAGLASKVTVDTQIVTGQHISSDIVVYRGPKAAIQLKYQVLWQEIFPGT